MENRLHLAWKTGLTFRPLWPPMENRLHLAWKKYGVFPPAAELFLRRMREQFESGS